MKYFKFNGAVYAFEEDGSQDHLISDEMEAMSHEEVDAHLRVNSERSQLTSLEFFDRFTNEEQLAVVQATMTNATIKLWYDKLLAASFVDLKDQRVDEGVNALIEFGLIAPERKPTILAGI